jgi:hypothetical protein
MCCFTHYMDTSLGVFGRSLAAAHEVHSGIASTRFVEISRACNRSGSERSKLFSRKIQLFMDFRGTVVYPLKAWRLLALMVDSLLPVENRFSWHFPQPRQ